MSTVVRGLSSNIDLNNPNAVVTGDIQGYHNTIDFSNGTLNGNVQGVLIDWGL